MATPLTYVPAPPRQPRPHTSLQILPVIDGAPGPHLAVQFIPDPCVFPAALPQDCWVTMGPAAGTLKTFDGPGDAVVSDNFGAYAGVECWLSGGMDEFSGVAERVLRNGEYKVVDKALTQLLNAAAVATTPATVSSIQNAVAVLEQTLAANVPAQGYLLMGAAAATVAAAAGLIKQPGLNGEITTFLGTPVVVVTDLSLTTIGSPPTSIAATIFAAGPITVWRSGIVATEAPEPTANTGRALAERLYAIAIECGVWKVQANLPTGIQQSGPGEEPEELELQLGSQPSSPVWAGTDITLTVHANTPPDDEVYVKYRLNGSGAWMTTSELTQVTPTQFVWNVDGAEVVAGDSLEFYAVSGSTESNHIVIEVT